MTDRDHHIELYRNGEPIRFTLAHEPTWEGRLIYEAEVVDAMFRFVQPGDCVIDAGANIGFFTLLLSRLVGDQGIVIAFEPDPKPCQTLRDNIVRNKMENTYSIHQALWSSDCEKDFWPCPWNGYSSFVQYDKSDPPIRLVARRLDTLLVSPQVSKPRLIKIDCEGAEEEILRGAEAMLRRGVECVVAEVNFKILEHHSTNSFKTLQEFMLDLGFDMFGLQSGYKPTHLPRGASVDPSIVYFNAMFAKKERVEELWSKPCNISI